MTAHYSEQTVEHLDELANEIKGVIDLACDDRSAQKLRFVVDHLRVAAVYLKDHLKIEEAKGSAPFKATRTFMIAAHCDAEARDDGGMRCANCMLSWDKGEDPPARCMSKGA